MSKSNVKDFVVKFDFEAVKDFMPEVRYDSIMDHLERLSHLESAIHSERSKLLVVARELECQILYSRKVIKEVNCENDS